MEPYRILVVDDSPFMRAIFSDLILRHSDFTIIETASNGEEAVEAVKRLKPDAVTLDLEMPRMNGIEALQIIMREEPTPVIMLSGISEHNMRETIKALQYGAFDFIRKPTSAVSDDIGQVGELLIEKLKIAVMTQKQKRLKPAALTPAVENEGGTAAATQERPKAARLQLPKPNLRKPKEAEPLPYQQVDEESHAKASPVETKKEPEISGRKTDEPKQATRPASELPDKKKPAAALHERKASETAKPAGSSTSFQHIVAIGTSTGGPRALHEVICSLPAELAAPVLVVQHMPPKFTKSLAQRLDSFSSLKVVEAEQGDRIRTGVVYIAPGGSHMEVDRDKEGYCIKLTQQPPRNGHRPAVDVLFESLVPYRELKRHAVIMTGMGSDGAKGMAALAENGAASTIAEAEETCVVYGMPRCAVENGSAKSVMPLQHIAPNLVHSVSK